MIVQWLYRASPRTFEDVLVDEYVKNIPDTIRKPSVRVIADNHVKLQKLTDFLAYQLHRRMATDSRNSERYQGMFIQLKLVTALIERDTKTEQQAKDQNAESKDNTWFDEAIEGVKKFLKK